MRQRLILVWVFVIGAAAHADTLHVPADYTLTEALEMAVDGDEIIVAPGFYEESLWIVDKAITVRSSGGKDVTTIHASPALKVEDYTDSSPLQSLVEGFTLAIPKLMIHFSQAHSQDHLLIRDCRFLGGLQPGIALSGSIEIHRCEFIDHEGAEALRIGSSLPNDGGAVTVRECLFADNALSSVVGVYLQGSVLIDRCTFRNNTLPWGWGDTTTLNVGSNCDVEVRQCLFEDGCITDVHQRSSLRYTNCTFPAFVMVEGRAGQVALTNCVVAPGAVFETGCCGGQLELRHCVIAHRWDGAGYGNIIADPLFVDLEAGDFRLAQGSPCIDAGVNAALGPDMLDDDGDGDETERAPLDFDGHPRFADYPGTPDVGCGVPVIVDVGAFEFQGTPVAPVIVGDVDGDGIVDAIDFLAVIAAWGDAPPCSLADVNLDGVVDAIDFQAVIAGWSGR